MKVINTKEPVILFLEDTLALCLSLWLALFFRYGNIPNLAVLQKHFYPFLIIFILWVSVFYLYGLYERHTSILRNRLPSMLINAFIINSAIAIIFFYFVPIFSIAPKTILFIFILISYFIIYFFRVFLYSKLFKVKKYNALLVGDSDEVNQIYDEVNNDKQYALNFVEQIRPNESFENFESEIKTLIEKYNISIIVIDFKNKKLNHLLPSFYSLLFKNIKFIDIYKVHEDVFYKVPISMIQHDWFVENISTSSKIFYDFCKRLIDFSVSFFGGLISIIFYPFIILAIKIENPKGSIFISQTRVGKNNKQIKIYKFRTMQRNENGVWIGESENKITKIGKFLRKTSLDELPQFWSILKGDLSIVGPRPDMVGLEERLSKEIPYYSIRYIIKPGLSGWAQVKQSVIPNSVEENVDRLAYDLYYVKNRSIILDIKIILKTIKTLFTRGGN